MKKLTPDQIQALHTFIKKHYVEYYDIELELVDHLANGIENQLNENDTISFDTALNIEFKKFGIFGFMSVIEKKQDTLNAYYLKLIFKEVIHFLHWPKLLLTAALYAIIYLLFDFLSQRYSNSNIVTTILWSSAFLSIVYLCIENMKIKKTNKKTHQKWFMDKVRLSIISFPLIIFYLLNSFGRVLHDASMALSSLSILFMGLWIYITYYVISPKLKLERDKTIQRILMIK